RAFEIIRNSIGYTKANVKICASHAGITTGEDGGSHQTFEDLALMRTIPGMTVVNPCDGVSTAKLLAQLVALEGPAYFRLGRAAVPMFYPEDAELVLGKGTLLREGTDLTIIATGIMVNEAMIAAEALKEEGIHARVIDMHTLKPIDEEIIIKAAKETGKIITAEEHSVIGGLGSAVADVVCQHAPVKMAMVGQQDTFGESGKPEELKEKYKMTAKDIVEKAKELV
ncbi:MAG: transketolase C-terminal domain-containing protein, partial [Anaerovoracaceae bacterium]